MQSTFLRCFFFFNDTATTEIYTLSLHDALPIFDQGKTWKKLSDVKDARFGPIDRKSTRLNSSHANISYAVFCLKKKKTQEWADLDGLKHEIKYQSRTDDR